MGAREIFFGFSQVRGECARALQFGGHKVDRGEVKHSLLVTTNR